MGCISVMFLCIDDTHLLRVLISFNTVYPHDQFRLAQGCLTVNICGVNSVGEGIQVKNKPGEKLSFLLDLIVL